MLELALPFVVVLVAMPVMAVLAFSAWLKRFPTLTVEERVKIWDVFIKGVPLTASSLAAAIAFIQYVDNRDREITKSDEARRQAIVQQERDLTRQENELAQRTREFNINFYKPLKEVREQKLALYNEAADILATIATQPAESAEYRIARARFYRLYWGQMSIIEKMPSPKAADIESQMVGFKMTLEKAERTGQRPPEGDRESLTSRALRLAHTFAEDLAALDRKDPQ